MAIKLFVQKGGEEPRELDFEGPVVFIGRGETNDLVVDDVRSSRKHCSVSETPQGAVLEDLGSSNGTSYNGEPVKRTLLDPGDKFAIGSTSFYYDKCSVSSSPEPVVEQMTFSSRLKRLRPGGRSKRSRRGRPRRPTSRIPPPKILAGGREELFSRCGR